MTAPIICLLTLIASSPKESASRFCASIAPGWLIASFWAPGMIAWAWTSTVGSW